MPYPERLSLKRNLFSQPYLLRAPSVIIPVSFPFMDWHDSHLRIFMAVLAASIHLPAHQQSCNKVATVAFIASRLLLLLVCLFVCLFASFFLAAFARA